MAHRTLGGIPIKAASAIANWVPVSFLPAGSALSETVVRAGSLNNFPFAMTQATVASPGDPVQLAHQGEVCKAIAGASLAAGDFVGVGSTNGILIPQAASAAATAMLPRYIVGMALKNAVAGDIFPIYLNPEQIV